jgi:hypothetical protein
MWWQEIGSLKDQLASPGLLSEAAKDLRLQVFSVELACVMAAAMLALSAVVVVDSLRRWYLMLRGPARQGVTPGGILVEYPGETT